MAKAAIYALKYLFSTSSYGISYHLNASNTLQAFNHFPAHHDKEAYSDAIPPLLVISTASLPTVMPAGAANLEMPSLSVSLSNYSNFAVCQVI